MTSTVEVELLSLELLARCFRTFTPEPHTPVVDALIKVVNETLVIQSGHEGLEEFIRKALDLAADEAGRLQLNGYHTSVETGRGRLNKRYPGDWVPIQDPRFLEGVARALCFVGENEVERRFGGQVLHAVQKQSAPNEADK